MYTIRVLNRQWSISYWKHILAERYTIIACDIVRAVCVITCANLPPRVKFPRPPQLLPVPQTVDPDRWLLTLTGKTFKRRLDHNGCFRLKVAVASQLGNQTYYVQEQLRGSYVIVWVEG